ncbi:MAG: DUF3524 domain-containing protein [Opitutales bacterium]|nr:DUF3524 domain-containing protein [Opitutales bacterium]MCH8539577.1 DUF3524 domain-containing protein [Opitutales bacterium]
MARILLLSAYHSASHKYWADGLQKLFPEHQWILRTQPARHFSWRVRASGWQWALGEDEAWQKRYDLIIATSLTQLGPLKALCPAFRDTPLWVYFHENQFAHPLGAKQKTEHQVGWQFQSMQNALLADAVSFNTEWNRFTFFQGAEKLLRKFPEKLPMSKWNRLKDHADCLPVPLDEEGEIRSVSKEPRLIVWNHRWEWDKQPERFLQALVLLTEQGEPFRLAMLGSGGGRNNDLAIYREKLADRIVHWGEADPNAYRDYLARASVGVSTAAHDFQGLGMLELAQAGARIVVPRRLAYPEMLPGACFYEGSWGNPNQDIQDLIGALRDVLSLPKGKSLGLVSEMPTWRKWRTKYAEKIASMAFL